MSHNTKTQKEIAKAVEEFEENFSWDFREIKKIPAHKNLGLWIKDFLTQKLEHLAKQKDEEFMKWISEEPAALIPRTKEHLEAYARKLEIRQEFRAELRNKLQGGKV